LRVSGRYLVKRGIVGRKGYIVSTGGYFGEDMILTDYVRDYSVLTLSFLDVFRLDRDDLMEQIKNNKFPLIGVRAHAVRALARAVFTVDRPWCVVVCRKWCSFRA
jgi:hypothetical protein